MGVLMFSLTKSTVRKTKKMLMILAASCPQTPNMSELYAKLETDRNAGVKIPLWLFGFLY